MIKRSLLVSILTLSSLSASAQTPLDLGEHLTLRTYTGQAAGLSITNQLNIKTMTLVQNTSSICTALAAGIGAEVVAHNRDNNVLRTLALETPEQVTSNASTLTEKQAVGLVFGGQTPPEQNYALVKATLTELAKANYEGAIFYHVAVWAPKMLEKVAAESAEVKAYLEAKTNMYALTINADQGKMLIHQVGLKQGQQASLKIVHQASMNDSWLDLFKRSLVKRN